MSKPLKASEDIQSLSDFRANAAQYVRQVQQTGRPLVLTQHGRGAAVLLDIHAYESLVERSELAADIQTAEAQLARGEGQSHVAARKRILKRVSR
jgi:antitoxin YefM